MRSSYHLLRSNVDNIHATRKRMSRPPRKTMPLMESPLGIRRSSYASLPSTTSPFSLLTNVVNITACLDRMISSPPATPIHNSYGLYAMRMPLIAIPFVHLHWIFFWAIDDRNPSACMVARSILVLLARSACHLGSLHRDCWFPFSLSPLPFWHKRTRNCCFHLDFQGCISINIRKSKDATIGIKK